MLRACRHVVAIVSISTLFPSLVFAQAGRAGIVTTLEGSVTARRVASPQPVALKFKDEIFVQDKITTGERSLARLLLGDKAIVTVRERSVFTVTETPGRSTVQVDSGKIGVAVGRDRMRPGEQIEIRTPGAIIAVRGTVLVVDVPAVAPDAAGAAAPPPAENVFVLRGSVEARVRTSPTAPLGPPMMINPFQVLTIRGGTGTVNSFTPQQVSGIVSGLRSSGMQFKEGANAEEAKSTARQSTTQLVQALVGPASGAQPGAPPPREGPMMADGPQPPPLFLPPIIPDFTAEDIANAGALQVSGFRFLPAGQRLVTFNGISVRDSTVPLADVFQADLIQGGNDDLIAVAPGAEARLSGTLASVRGSNVFTGGNFLDVAGTLIGNGGQPFLYFNPSTVFAPGSLVDVRPSGRLLLNGQLLSDVGSTFVTPGNFLSVAGLLQSSSPAPLMQFGGSTLIVGTPGTGSSFFSLTGPAARAMLAGPGFSAVGGTLAVFGASFFRVEGGAQLQSSTPAHFILLDGVTIDADTSQAAFVIANASANFAGGLFVGRGVIDAGAGTGGGGSAGGLGGSPGAGTPMLGMVAASASFGSSVFDLVDTNLELSNSELVALGLGSVLSVNGGPLLRMTNSMLDVNELLAIDPSSRLNLAGPIFETIGSTVLTAGDLIPVKLGATIESSSSAPLIGLTNSIASVGDAVFGLRGRPGQTASEVAEGVNLTLGTDRPITHAGPWLATSGATVTAQKVLALDTALLEASAPLLRMMAGSSFTSGLDAIEMSTMAKLTSVGPLVALDASSLIVNTGAVLNLNNGSLVRVTGDLFSLVNGSSLRTNSGPLVRVGGNSVLDVSGALVAFGGSGGNSVNVTNALCFSICAAVGGIPMHFVNGASGANVTIGPNPYKNPGLGTVMTSGSQAAVIVVDGPNSKVKITAP